MYLWFKGVKFGKCLRSEGRLEVANGRNVELGDNVKLGKGIFLGAFKTGKLTVGSNTYIGRHSIILAYERVTIGDDCLIAPGCHITDVNHGFRERGRLIRLQEYESEAVTIGRDVWVGAGVSILPGVTVGEGSVIGARAVVTKEVACYSIVAGIPARVIGKRS